MLWTALEDPDPVLIFENGVLYNMEGELAADAGPVDISKAAIRRPAKQMSLITYGGTLFKTMQAAEELARGGRSTRRSSIYARFQTARYGDDRRLRKPDTPCGHYRRRLENRQHLRRDYGADCGKCFLRARRAGPRVCSVEAPMPYTEHPEDDRNSQVPGIVAAARPVAMAMSAFRTPLLGADMQFGTIVEWRVKPGDTVNHGDVVALVETEKGVIEVEIFENGVIESLVIPPGRLKFPWARR